MRRESAGLGGVAGADRDQALPQPVGGQGEGGREKAADLEAAGWLQALGLQGGALDGEQRRAQDMRPGPLGGRADALERDHV